MGGKGGFTLIEVLVAITVASLVLLSVYGVFTSISAAKTRLEAEEEGYRLARVLFDRIGREVRGAYLRADNPATLFAGGTDGEGRPFLALSTAASTPASGREGGISVVRYTLRPDGETAGEKVLFRQEYPFFDRTAARPEYRLTGGITEFRLRFFAESEWREEWATGSGLPQQVEMSLTLTVDGRPVVFRSAFELPDIEP